MKNLLTAIILCITLAAGAQTKEFTIALSESSLSLRPGESKTVTVLISRSKSFSKGDADMGTASTLPQGIAITYSPASGNFESTIATITATPATAVGTYSIVLNSTIRYKTKGSILKLMVTNDNVAAK